MAEKKLGSLSGARMLVLGAGDMGEGMVGALSSKGVAEVLVANRTWDRAVGLADRVGGRAVHLGELAAALAEVDVVLTSTGASSVLVEVGDLAPVMEGRAGRPLLIVDVAVPRDVDPGVAALPGVTLLDMDDLKVFAEQGLEGRRREIAKVDEIIDAESERFLASATARELAPLIVALRERAESVRTGELERFRSKLDGLSEEQREAVEAVTRGIIQKLLHDPTVVVKESAGSAKGDRLAEALRALFDL
jgi:glutamyl-tRNA reductase